MADEIEKFKKGIFALHTRRLGTVAELMIEALFGYEKSKNQYHDRYDAKNQKRVEVKFSVARRKNSETINMKNVIEQCKKAPSENRLFSSSEVDKIEFDSNIQQIKPKEFDLIYYGLFFTDKIAIFKMEPKSISSGVGYSDKQHKGNVGEGQFHLTFKKFDYHLQHYLERWLTYEELYQLFKEQEGK